MPAGRPRKPESRDLPPGVYRRVRGGKARYYDADGKALGSDKARAALSVAQRAADIILAPGTWRHASNEYRLWMDSPECTLAKQSKSNYVSALKSLDKVFGVMALHEIRPSHVGAIMRETRSQPSKGNMLKAVISSVWKLARSWGYTDSLNPAEGIPAHRIAVKMTAVEDDWVRAVAEHGDQVLRDYIALALVAGPRVVDCLELQRSNVVGDELQLLATKNRVGIRIAIEGDLRRVLDDLLTRQRKVSGPYLIQTNTGRRVTYGMIRHRWGKALAAAKAADPSVPHFTPRSMRSKSATDAPDDAQARLGHTRETMTKKHYIKRAKLAGPGVLPDGILVKNSG